MAVKQTAGREALGEFAPKFAELNDDVLFGQVCTNFFANKLNTFTFIRFRLTERTYF